MKQSNIFKKFFVTSVTIFAFTFLAYGKVIYVDINLTTGNNDGTSWCDAYRDLECLQDALDEAVSGDQILVADGTYKPSKRTYPSNARTATFQLKNGVAIYGGYEGSVIYLGSCNPSSSRDITTYVTILSGEIGGSSITDNCYHVVTGSGTDSSAVLDGFKIEKGYANGISPYNYGGGMYNNSGSPTISNCTFSSNNANGDGGGMHNHFSSPTVSNCTFSSNKANWNGGGMYNYRSNPTISQCTFSNNEAKSLGGGMLNNGNATVTRCMFFCNSATGLTGLGGGIFSSYGSAVFKNCVIYKNSASKGGGFAINGYNLEIKNCTIYQNTATNGYGGAIYCYGNSPNVTVCNSILWEDIASSGSEIYVAAGTVNVSYSDVKGGWAGPGNINADPKFVDPNGEDDILCTADDNFRLRCGSPCIDAGSNACASSITGDMDGNPRFIDDYSTPDTGSGTAPIVDMGAYEFQDPLRTHFLKTDYRGYLGIGTFPKATLHIGSDRGFTISDTPDKALSWNAYYENGWKYLGTDLAAQFYMDYTNHKFYLNAATVGQAGSAVNWANILTLQADGKVGIGTNTPKEMIQIGSGKGLTIHAGEDPAMSWNAYYDNGWKYMGDDYAIQLHIGPNSDSLVLRTAASGQKDSAITWIDGLTYMANGNVAIGTTDSQGYKLAVKGGIIAESLVIKPYDQWPDNVFEPGYPLLPIADLEKHIKEKESLPGIPTSEYIAEKGMNVGETQVKMLQKIEELTLYVIELKKENESLKKRLSVVEEKHNK